MQHNVVNNVALNSLSLYRESGLKYDTSGISPCLNSLSLYRESGLKSFLSIRQADGVLSLPV